MDDKKIDDLISIIDSFMEKGGGHMNVKVNDIDNLDTVEIEEIESSCCTEQNMACRVPTLHEGLEDLEQD